MSKYPECEKLQGIQDERVKLVSFTEWLSANGLTLCTHEPTHFAVHGGAYWQTRESPDDIVLRYFGIDKKKLEEERSQIIEAQQKRNEG